MFPFVELIYADGGLTRAEDGGNRGEDRCLAPADRQGATTLPRFEGAP